MAARLKIKDEVIVTVGKDKGRRGTVLKILSKNRVLVEGVNIIKKHTKPNPNINQQGGIVEKEAPIHISNVALYNSVTKKADRVGFKTLDDGGKVRYFKSSGEVVDV